MAPSVSFAREIYPFRVSELVSHEVQIAAVHRAQGHQTDYLVKGYTTTHRFVLVSFLEMPVHIGIDQPENNRLVADECLVMTLAITDGFLVGAAVFHFPEESTRFPILVLFFLNQFYPIVGNVHRHAVVEAISALIELHGQPRHPTDFLGNGERMGTNLVNQQVG